jgi:hypothetical protein
MRRKFSHATKPAPPSSESDDAAPHVVEGERSMAPGIQTHASLEDDQLDQEETELRASLQSRSVREQFRQSFEDLRAGRTTPLEVFLRQLKRET